MTINAQDAGYHHNVILNLIASETENPETLGDIENLLEYQQITYDYIYQNSDDLPEVFTFSSNDLSVLFDQFDSNSLVDSLYTHNLISFAVKNKLGEIFDIATGSTTLVSANSSYNNLIAAVSVDLSLSTDEKNLIIGTASVASSTLEFWSAAYSNSSSPYYSMAQFNPEDQPEVVMLFNWKKFGIDCLGFAAGYIVGSTLSTPAGGIAAGVAVGGWASSCYKDS